MKRLKFGLIICGILLVGAAKAQDAVYSVNIDEAIENGKVSADKTEDVSEGETIILTITPDVGYELNEISYFETDHKDTEVKIDEEEGIYSFKMPAHHVIVTAIFTKTETSDCELPEIQIVRKQGSAILICNISKDEYAGISYKWGYITQVDTTWIMYVEINGEMKTDSQYIDCQYIQFPENIIDNYVCIVQITKDNCVTYGDYLPPKSSNSLSPPQITTYPNPTKNHLSLTLENSIKGRFTVSILNIYGQTVFSKQYTEYRKNEVLSLDFNLTAGMYLLTVQTKEEVLTSKIVIK